MVLHPILVRIIVLERAMYEKDTDTLYAAAPCDCCCDEHTFISCLARLWGGCRGGLPLGAILVDDQWVPLQ